MNIQAMARIELAPGDRIVTAVAHRNCIVVITEQGNIFRITGEEL
jgi:hypothetical protein